MSPWMLANEQSMYELNGVWRRHIEWVWSVDARTVTDDWSPDLAARADDWAAWQEEVELRALMEAEFAEYQRQMEVAYQRRLYEEQEESWRQRSWMPVDGGTWW